MSDTLRRRPMLPTRTGTLRLKAGTAPQTGDAATQDWRKPAARRGKASIPAQANTERRPSRETEARGDAPSRRDDDTRPARPDFRDRPRRDDADRAPRRFGDERPRRDDDRRPGRRDDAGFRRDDDTRPARPDFRDRPRRDDADRAPRRFGDERPRRDDDRRPDRRDDAGFRRDDDTRPARPDFRDRPRRDDADRAPRRFGEERPRREDDRRPGRRDDAGFRRDDDTRPARPDFRDRPRRDDADRAPRRFGDERPRRDDDRRPGRRDDAGFRRDDDTRPARPDFRDRPRRDDADRAPRRFGDERPRRDDDRRPGRVNPDARPPRRDDANPPARRPGERPFHDADSRGRRDDSRPAVGRNSDASAAFGRARTATRPAARPDAPPRHERKAWSGEDRPAPPPSPLRIDGSIRLSKRMTELGLCSRREADEYIEKGWVRVDGRVVSELGARVRPGQEIELDRRGQTAQDRRVTILLNKPVGYVSGQAEDGYQPASMLLTPENRWAEDATDNRWLRTHMKGLAPAGRLDIDSIGLLVFTQDGRTARALIGDDSDVEKEYHVRVEGHLAPEGLALLNHGLSLDGQALRPAKVSWLNEDQLRFVLREGKKRQIRRMCELVCLKVVGLKRVRIGRVLLGPLPPGQWRYLASWEKF